MRRRTMRDRPSWVLNFGPTARSGSGGKNSKSSYRRFIEMSARTQRKFSLDDADLYPCLDDASSETPFDRHYTYHPAWAARILAQTKPAKHVDISSTLNFAAIASAFVPVDFYDLRPAPIKLSSLSTGYANLLALDFADGAIASLSCMHVIEHVGLGRYADPLDPNGDLKAIAELQRVLAPGGDLLVVTPVGRPRIQFNAHRIYDHRDFREYFAQLRLVEFSLVTDGEAPDGLISWPPDEQVLSQSYGCGCFWFKKPAV